MKSQFSRPLRIGMVAGELSGDTLGAGLLQALRQHCPDLQIEGIGGPQMQAAGCHSLFPLEYLSVMGLGAVLRRLPKLLSIRHQIIKHFLTHPPDIFIGIDAPDFNLTVEDQLHAAGIPTAHYVSPSVWAWKSWRIKKIKRAVDLMLTILPFEAEYYQQHAVPVRFVGHPLADAIPVEDPITSKQRVREKLQLTVPNENNNHQVLALLPGSRRNEVHYLGPLFLQTALWCKTHYPHLQVIAPMANAMLKAEFTRLWQQYAPDLPLRLYDGQAQAVLAAADVALVTSGTATLEAMLVNRPMVVAYRLSNLSYAIARCMVKTKYISLPNLLAKKMLVPEFIQQRATVANLGPALLSLLADNPANQALQQEFTTIHHLMQRNASQQAAAAVLELLNYEPTLS